MAYVDATADDLQTAFPRFADVEDATVTYWLTRAQRSVDETWTEDDFAMGQMLLAAHYLTLEGYGTGTEAMIASKGLGDFKSVRSGSFSLDRGDAGGSASGTLLATSYGRRFAELAKVNVGGPRVMGTGTVPTSPPNRWGV
jgi:hypothetical protein